MKSMANIYHRQDTFRKTKAGEMMAKKETDLITHRLTALVLATLHNHYGFGPQRLADFLGHLTEEAEEAEKDDLWYDVLTGRLEQYMGVDLFKEDYRNEKSKL